MTNLKPLPRPSRPVSVPPLAAVNDRTRTGSPTGPRRKLPIGGKLAAALLAATVVAVAFHQARPRPAAPAAGVPPCETAIATRGSVAGLLTVTGRLLLDRPVRVTSDGPGRVVAIQARVGERVKAGQVMARLEDAAERAAVMGAGAKVTAAALLNLRAERELGRMLESLRDEGLTVPLDPDELLDGAVGDAQLELIHTVAQSAKEEAAMVGARAALARRTVRAPVDGVVRFQSVEVGESIAGGVAGEPLFVIDTHPTRLRLETEIDERHVATIAPGPATFTTPGRGTQEFAATIEGLGARDGIGSPARFVVMLAVENGSGALSAGMSATVDLPARSPASAAHVPSGALRSALGQAGSVVWIPDREGDGRPVPLPVAVGVTGEGLTEIAAPGLGAGYVVVMDPSPQACRIVLPPPLPIPD